VETAKHFHFYYWEQTTMQARTVLGVIVMMLVLVQAGTAGGKGDIQKYFSDTAVKVKATDNPTQKRDILDKSLQNMSRALDKVESLGLVSKEDRAGLNRFKTALQAKQNELKGIDGYERVAHVQLNAYADYVVQDMEQAAETVTISLVAALLIIIILILIL
jgi:hypothetical protein